MLNRISANARRSTCLGVLAAGAILLVVTAASQSGPDPARAESKRPNVVVLMTDDQTVRDLRGMRHTRRLLAQEGVRFTRSFVSYPLCCPSRATYLSGRYPHNHKVRGLHAPTGGYGRFRKANSLPVWLRRAGYYSAHIGKFLNGYGSEAPADVPPGWNEWYGAIDPTTYRMWGYTLNENGRRRSYGRRFDEDPDLYQTDVYSRKATDFIDRRSRESDPFFLSVAFLAPHHEEAPVRARTGVTVRSAPRHRGARRFTRRQRPRSFNEPDISDKPRFRRRQSPRLDRRAAAQIAANYRARQESLMAVDEAVRDIVASLRRNGVLQRTYILFTSDNGFLQGEHRVRSGKMLVYDPSTGVPLLVRGPGIPRGRVSSELVTNEDLAPTITKVARARPGGFVDGRSLLPYARRPRRHSRRPLLHETGGLKPVTIPGQDTGPFTQLKRILTYRAVRTRRYLWVEYRNGSRELYDRRRDPAQLHSLHADPRYAAARRALHRLSLRLARCRGRACRAPTGSIPGPTS
jgi:N-acetylglucosamine-6-sulfatase